MACIVRPYIPNVTLAAIRDRTNWPIWGLTPAEQAIIGAAISIHDRYGVVRPMILADRLRRSRFYIRQMIQEFGERGLWPFPTPRMAVKQKRAEETPGLTGDPYLDDEDMPEPNSAEKERIRSEIIKARCRKRAAEMEAEPPIGWWFNYRPRVHVDPRGSFDSVPGLRFGGLTT